MSIQRRPRRPAWVLGALFLLAVVAALSMFTWGGRDPDSGHEVAPTVGVTERVASVPFARSGEAPASASGPKEKHLTVRDRLGQPVRPDPLIMGQPRQSRLWEEGDVEQPPPEEWDAEELDLEEGEEFRDPEWEWPEDQEPTE